MRRAFSDLLTEEVTLVKTSGEVIDGIAASVQKGKIFIGDTSLPIEEEDLLTRVLPSGIVEKYMVLDSGLIVSEGKAHHFETEVQKLTTQEVKRKYSEPALQVIANITGDNARVNTNSTDNSVNTVSHTNDNQVFVQLKNAVNSVTELEQHKKDNLIKAIDEMESSVGKKTFKEKYNEFIKSLADHATVFTAVGPMIPELTKYI